MIVRHLWKYSLVILAGCQSPIDYAGMENSEKAFNERQSQQLCAFMDRETMFPDPVAQALARAAQNGKIETIDELVAKGANPSMVGTRNCSVLFWAMQNEAGFQRLLELGANPNIVFGDGGSVMHWAAGQRDTTLLSLSLEYGGDPNLFADGDTPIFETISSAAQSSQSMVMLLEAGADVNAVGKYGSTPMLTAAGVGRFDLVLLLLKSGADVAINDRNGHSLEDKVQEKLHAFEHGSKQETWVNQVNHLLMGME